MRETVASTAAVEAITSGRRAFATDTWPVPRCRPRGYAVSCTQAAAGANPVTGEVSTVDVTLKVVK